MSNLIAELVKQSKKKNLTRAEMLALVPPILYEDGRTKQSFKDETDINVIMARADIAGTISHLEKYEGVYADFSDFDFHDQTEKLTQGRMIFDDLPAEVRMEFGQNPQAFFDYVNDPKNVDDLLKKLPHLAKPGKQLLSAKAADADTEAALAAASEPVASENLQTVLKDALDKIAPPAHKEPLATSPADKSANSTDNT